MPNNAPFPYHPTTTAEKCKGSGEVEAGDWVQFFVGWPTELQGRGRAVKHGHQFLIHMLYTPNSDDAANKNEDQSTTYGGSANGETGNRRREYRIDPGWMFQAPFNGQLSLVAGADSDDDVIVPVLIVKGYHPRIWLQQQAILAAQGPVAGALAATCNSPIEWLHRMECMQIESADKLTRGPRAYAPPVVGTPQLAPCTYVDLLDAGGGGTPISFPDGAVQVESGEACRLTVAVMGNALALAVPAGFRRPLGALAQGGQVTNSTPATWIPNVVLASLTFWSVLGG